MPHTDAAAALQTVKALMERWFTSYMDVRLPQAQSTHSPSDVGSHA